MDIKIGDVVKDLSDNQLMVAVEIRHVSERHGGQRLCCWCPKYDDFYWYDLEDVEGWLEVIR